jgi:hypothetical protein
MGKTGASRSGLKRMEKKLSTSVNNQREKMYLRGKEELTGTQAGKPRWDESFFKAAAKQKEFKGVKY